MQRRGGALTRERQLAAGRLAKAVTRELRDLGFAKAGFGVELTAREPASHGCDTVTFRFAPNPGEASSVLREIASSGEISRVMLAVKSVLAEHDRIPVLVFDEIDANIGGEVGRAVGRKLRALATRRQVICITHLPQVAAYGHAHFAVTKHWADAPAPPSRTSPTRGARGRAGPCWAVPTLHPFRWSTPADAPDLPAGDTAK